MIRQRIPMSANDRIMLDNLTSQELYAKPFTSSDVSVIDTETKTYPIYVFWADGDLTIPNVSGRIKIGTQNCDIPDFNTLGVTNSASVMQDTTIYSVDQFYTDLVRDKSQKETNSNSSTLILPVAPTSFKLKDITNKENNNSFGSSIDVNIWPQGQVVMPKILINITGGSVIDHDYNNQKSNSATYYFPPSNFGEPGTVVKSPQTVRLFCCRYRNILPAPFDLIVGGKLVLTKNGIGIQDFVLPATITLATNPNTEVPQFVSVQAIDDLEAKLINNSTQNTYYGANYKFLGNHGEAYENNLSKDGAIKNWQAALEFDVAYLRLVKVLQLKFPEINFQFNPTTPYGLSTYSPPNQLFSTIKGSESALPSPNPQSLVGDQFCFSLRVKSYEAYGLAPLASIGSDLYSYKNTFDLSYLLEPNITGKLQWGASKNEIPKPKGTIRGNILNIVILSDVSIVDDSGNFGNNTQNLPYSRNPYYRTLITEDSNGVNSIVSSATDEELQKWALDTAIFPDMITKYIQNKTHFLYDLAPPNIIEENATLTDIGGFFEGLNPLPITNIATAILEPESFDSPIIFSDNGNGYPFKIGGFANAPNKIIPYYSILYNTVISVSSSLIFVDWGIASFSLNVDPNNTTFGQFSTGTVTAALHLAPLTNIFDKLQAASINWLRTTIQDTSLTPPECNFTYDGTCDYRNLDVKKFIAMIEAHFGIKAKA